ncbi:hypothetical protein HY968_02105 [Candidatus Kaiserbacteria bacterium]|nr:hypothetical protein [Candidatus Kaiserbacteria bacterium]
MVVHRTLQTIESLKGRPRHERRAVALIFAASITLVLFIGWLFFFVRNIHNLALQSTSQTAGAGVVEIR